MGWEKDNGNNDFTNGGAPFKDANGLLAEAVKRENELVIGSHCKITGSFSIFPFFLTSIMSCREM